MLHDRQHATVLPIMTQVERLGICGPSTSADEVLAEFAAVGQPIPEAELEERRLEQLWWPSDERYFVTDERNLLAYDPYQPQTDRG